MRKIAVIIFAYLALSFGICVGIANVQGNVPALLPGSQSQYLFFRTLLIFFNLLPALLCSAFLVAASIIFGQSEQQAFYRFSPTMLTHYKKVMIASFCMVFTLAMVKEIFIPLVRAQQEKTVNAPHLLHEYLDLARNASKEGNDELAHEYALFALKIDPTDKTALAVIEESEAHMQIIQPTVALPAGSTENGILYAEIQNETVQSLIEKSKTAARLENWFNAHYYAQLAVATATGKDINLTEARKLAADAWRELSNPAFSQELDQWQFFNKKRQAYFDLMTGNTLKAYYQFLELSQNTSGGMVDLDVKTFLQVALERLSAECFFIDETLNLQRFESARNVYFTIHHSDGKTDAVYISGVTNVRNTGGLLTYLRGFTMYTYSQEGTLLRTITTPYAKMVAHAVESFTQQARQEFDIKDEFELVPRLQLKSVARDNANEINEPVYEYSELGGMLTQLQKDALVLSMSIDDFNLVCEASIGADKMNLPALFKIVPKASGFGYAAEIFNAALVRRLVYPLVMLLLFVFCATFAWNYRLSHTQLFKFRWIFVLPFASWLLYLIIEILLFVADLLCYAFIGVIGNALLPVAITVCVVLLFAVSALFLSRTAQ